MKKPSFCGVVLTIVLGTFLFSEIKGTVNRDKQFFLIRWIYSDRNYAKQIEIKPYLLNDEQVAHMFAHPDEEIQQPTQMYLSRRNSNLVLRIKNHGEAHAWGTLSWQLADYGWQKFDIDRLPPANPSQGEKFYDFVIPMDIVVSFDDDLPPHKITTKWNSLYTTYP